MAGGSDPRQRRGRPLRGVRDGLPIGNLTSQFWANCYLDPFDHFVKRELRCPAYLRYVDDFLLFGDDQRQLGEWRRAIIDRLSQLRLTVHLERAQVQPVKNGIPFLGFLVYPERRRLKHRKGVAYVRRLRQMVRQYASGQIAVDRITASVQGWVNHLRYGNTVGLRKAVLNAMPIVAKD